ncbi:hypothetical protein U9M48_041867 [Paspalum notatum var. saurae]|uniref:Transposase n=1 Tax=Paspalum notatum var. saurae TaxID=547442 RepID=A0AAQ3UTZ6_PASNO
MDKESSSEDQDIVAMVKQMQKKFMQYWKITYLSFFIPVILDPRFKYSFVDFGLNRFSWRNTIPKLDRVMSTLKKLFSEYSQTNHSNAELAHKTRYAEVNTLKDDSFDDWDQHRSAQQRTQSSNELNAYLAEIAIPRTDEFDILARWKSNCTTYPILSRMACDVLSTPASTVPSESAFSTGQRVVSDFRSRLNPSTVEALIYLQDWMRAVAPSPDEIALQVVAPPVSNTTMLCFYIQVYKTPEPADHESGSRADYTEELYLDHLLHFDATDNFQW